MKTSRITLVLLAVAALTAVGFSAAGSEVKAQATQDCGSCSSCCTGCCGK